MLRPYKDDRGAVRDVALPFDKFEALGRDYIACLIILFAT